MTTHLLGMEEVTGDLRNNDSKSIVVMNNDGGQAYRLYFTHILRVTMHS